MIQYDRRTVCHLIKCVNAHVCGNRIKHWPHKTLSIRQTQWNQYNCLQFEYHNKNVCFSPVSILVYDLFDYVVHRTNKPSFFTDRIAWFSIQSIQWVVAIRLVGRFQLLLIIIYSNLYVYFCLKCQNRN